MIIFLAGISVLRVKDLSPRFDICVYKIFPEKFLEMGFDPLNTLSLIVYDDISPIVKCYLTSNWTSVDYVSRRHYLFNLKRSDMFNPSTGLSYEDNFLRERYQISIRGTKYEELIKDGPL